MTQREPPSKVTRWAAPFLVAMATLVLVLQGIGEPGVRELVRWTARASFLIFLVAFATPFFSSASWLARNRHGILVTLAISFGIHALAVGWLGIHTHGVNLIERSSAFDVVAGLGAYSFLILLALSTPFPLRRPRPLLAVGRLGLRLLSQSHQFPTGLWSPGIAPGTRDGPSGERFFGPGPARA